MQAIATNETVGACDDTARHFVESLCRELSTGRVSLPSFPDVLIRIRSVASDAAAPLDRVVRVVQAEPVLAARLLRLANAACHAGSAPAADLRGAIARLGHEAVRNFAVAEATRQLLQARTQPTLRPHMQGLWHHCVRVAALARIFAARSPAVNADTALLAGLLHDIGKAYILSRMRHYPALLGDPRVLPEILADWHGPVGHAILESWDLPEEIASVAEEHDNLDREPSAPSSLLDVVTAANLIANRRKTRAVDESGDGSDPAIWLHMNAAQMAVLVRDSSGDLRALERALVG